jgi:hypothetical protein
MKTTILSVLFLFCLNLQSQVTKIVLENYSIFQIPTNMDFNDAVQNDSIKNALLYPYKLTYEFDFNNEVINMTNDRDWSISCKMSNVIFNDGDHFKVLAKVNEEYYTFFLCKDVNKQVNILICLELTPELPHTQGVYSDVLTYSIK